MMLGKRSGLFNFFGQFCLFLFCIELFGCAANLKVRVNNSLNQNQPVSGAIVSVEAASATKYFTSKETGGDGSAGFTVTQGIYTIEVKKTGYNNQRQSITIEKDQPEVVAISLPPKCTITGSISLHAQGNPHPKNATVYLITNDQDKNKVGQSEIAGDGSFIMQDLAPGDYIIMASGEFAGKRYSTDQVIQLNSVSLNISLTLEEYNELPESIRIPDPNKLDMGVPLPPKTQ